MSQDLLEQLIELQQEQEYTSLPRGLRRDLATQSARGPISDRQRSLLFKKYDHVIPRQHLPPSGFLSWFEQSQTAPTVWVNYAQETGTWDRPWPKELKIEHHRGRVEHLIRAATGEEVPLLAKERTALAPRGPLHLFAYWTRPALRVLGRRRISMYLGISEDQLSDRVRDDEEYQAAIKKVGWLLVSTTGLLDSLDVTRQRALRRARRQAAGKRRRPGPQALGGR